MLPTFELGPDFQLAHTACREAVSRFVQLLSRQGELRRLDACSDAYGCGVDSEHIYFVQAGSLVLRHGEKALWNWSEGDLFGIEHFGAAHGRGEGELLAVPDFALLIAFPRRVVEQAIADEPVLRNLWLRITALQQSLLHKLIGRLVEKDNAPTPGFRRCQQDEVIIAQGEEPDYVYTLIEGHAEVLVDGVRVGEVSEDEIFGALAVLTGERRSATVVATRPCTLLMVHRDEFFTLVKSHPHLFMALVQDMAKTILKLNSRVVDRQGA